MTLVLYYHWQTKESKRFFSIQVSYNQCFSCILAEGMEREERWIQEEGQPLHQTVTRNVMIYCWRFFSTCVPQPNALIYCGEMWLTHRSVLVECHLKLSHFTSFVFLLIIFLSCGWSNCNNSRTLFCISVLVSVCWQAFLLSPLLS